MAEHREQIRELIDAELARFGVPGAAVAVVHEGEVLLVDGFGRRNLDNDLPVTASTRYMIASDSKVFAAATVALLAEDGLLELDAPVRTYVPWFEMHDPVATQLTSARDLLAHRTGLPRHDMMTIGDGTWELTNELLARAMRHLEPKQSFRQGFGYNNCHYATAGFLSEAVTGKPWRETLQERLLSPIGMIGSGTYDPVQTNGDFAVPYRLGDDGELIRLAFQSRRYDLPNGGIVSTAVDLAQWTLARLGLETNGARVLSDGVLRELHTPCTIFPNGLASPEIQTLGYGLGVAVLSLRGTPFVMHGGAQIGFGGQVAIVPSTRSGVAVETNLHGSALPNALALGILEILLGTERAPWGERMHAAGLQQRELLRAHLAKTSTVDDPQPPPRPLSDYASSYTHGAYGTFTVTVEADETAGGDGDGNGNVGSDIGSSAERLVPHFHGFTDRLELRHLDGDTWQVVLLDLDQLRPRAEFRADDSGAITSLAIGFDQEIGPILFTRD